MNPFFLAAGILAVLLSGAHAFWGEKFLLSELKASSLSRLTKVGTQISWHQTTLALLTLGLALVTVSLSDSIAGANTLAVLAAILIVGNLVVFTAISMARHRELIGQSVPQIFLFALLISLISLGIVLE